MNDIIIKLVAATLKVVDYLFIQNVSVLEVEVLTIPNNGFTLHVCMYICEGECVKVWACVWLTGCGVWR